VNKPSNVTTAGALLLAGGIWSLLFALVMTVSTCGLWFTSWTYAIAAAIVSIVNGAKLLGDPQGKGVPKATSIMQICQILQGDFIGMTLGIIALVLLGDRETVDYLEGRVEGGHMNAGYGYGAHGAAVGHSPGQGYGQQPGYEQGQPGYEQGQPGYGQGQPGYGPPAQAATPPAQAAPPGWGDAPGTSEPPTWSPPTEAQAPPTWSNSTDSAAEQPAWPASNASVSPPTWSNDTHDDAAFESSRGDSEGMTGFSGHPGTGTAAENLTFDQAITSTPEKPVAKPMKADPFGETQLERYRIAPWSEEEEAAEEVAAVGQVHTKTKS